jgi:beta-glucosidase
MRRITARDPTATGLHWTFSPVLGTVRDPRWERVNETFGEASYLVGVLWAAMIQGYQGNDLSAPDTILACIKHYAGCLDMQGGRNSSEDDIPHRKLLSFVYVCRTIAHSDAEFIPAVTRA